MRRNVRLRSSAREYGAPKDALSRAHRRRSPVARRQPEAFLELAGHVALIDERRAERGFHKGHAAEYQATHDIQLAHGAVAAGARAKGGAELARQGPTIQLRDLFERIQTVAFAGSAAIMARARFSPSIDRWTEPMGRLHAAIKASRARSTTSILPSSSISSSRSHSPAALFALGGALALQSLHRRTAVAVCLITVAKLVVYPLLVWLVLGRMMQLDAFWLNVGVLIASLPSAGNIYVLAQRYAADLQRVSAAILLSTLVSVVSFPCVAWLALD